MLPSQQLRQGRTAEHSPALIRCVKASASQNQSFRESSESAIPDIKSPKSQIASPKMEFYAKSKKITMDMQNKVMDMLQTRRKEDKKSGAFSSRQSQSKYLLNLLDVANPLRISNTSGKNLDLSIENAL